MFDTLSNDIRHAARTLMARPVFNAADLTGMGLGRGVVGAIALGIVLKSPLFGVGSIDLPGLTMVVALLGAIAFVACWLPARRAAATTRPRHCATNEQTLHRAPRGHAGGAETDSGRRVLRCLKI
ncbi:hypothetical protein [Dokdonella sp.]|uniref:hypothetical protein n=1 Tax=Dokdonella sp. TaxID=2291710 RepID=UPI003528C693